MAKFASDTVMDAALAVVDNATRMVACSGQPANFAGIAAVALADIAMTAGAGNGDYVLADGDTSGRKLTVVAQNGVTVDNSGTFNHVSLDDGTTLLYVTTGTSQALTAANTCNFPNWDIEIADPT